MALAVKQTPSQILVAVIAWPFVVDHKVRDQ